VETDGKKQNRLTLWGGLTAHKRKMIGPHTKPKQGGEMVMSQKHESAVKQSSKKKQNKVAAREVRASRT